MSGSNKRILDPCWLVGLAALQLSAAGCTPNADAPKSESPPVDIARVDPRPPQTSSSAGEGAAPSAVPHGIADGDPLQTGLVRFTGMLRPTKGGIDLRGVTLSLEALSQALATDGHAALGYDDLLGDRVSVVAELASAGDGAEPESKGVAVQRRSGSYFVVSKLVSAQIEAEAEQIEGEVHRSKGFFSVSTHLVSRDDLRWALPGVEDATGARVKLWGQPRIEHCAPEAQCLIGGSLPLFDVARAERVP